MSLGFVRRHAARMDGMPHPTLTHRVTVVEAKVAALETGLRDLKAEFAAFRTEVLDEFGKVRGEIRDGLEEIRRYMRVLHEEVIARIATIQEGPPPPGNPTPRRS